MTAVLRLLSGVRLCAWAFAGAVVVVASMGLPDDHPEPTVVQLEALPLEVSFDTTGIEDGAAWGGVVLFTGWWVEPT